MGPYIHGVLIFDGSLYSEGTCIQWVLIFTKCLCSMRPYIQGVLVFDGSLYSWGTYI